MLYVAMNEPSVLLTILLLATAVAVLGSLVGLILGNIGRTRMELLVHVATGCLLGITAFDILPEAKSVLPWPSFLLACLFGYGLLWSVGRFVFFVCPSCAIAHTDGEAMARKGSIILLSVALGIHCLLDGLAVSTGGLLSTRAEAGAMFAVGVHKFPEGLALGLVLTGARYRKSAALLIAAGIELLTVIGGAGGLIVPRLPTQIAVGAIFAIVGGGFVYLVCNAMAGALTHHSRMPRLRSLTVEGFSFAATGVLFWAANRAWAW